MANLTKAQLIATNPGLGLKLSQTKDSILDAIQASKKSATTSSKSQRGER